MINEPIFLYSVSLNLMKKYTLHLYVLIASPLLTIPRPMLRALHDQVNKCCQIVDQDKVSILFVLPVSWLSRKVSNSSANNVSLSFPE